MSMRKMNGKFTSWNTAGSGTVVLYREGYRKRERRDEGRDGWVQASLPKSKYCSLQELHCRGNGSLKSIDHTLEELPCRSALIWIVCVKNVKAFEARIDSCESRLSLNRLA